MPVVSTTATVAELIAESASALRRGGVCIGHHADNPIDEARVLVLHALRLPEQWPASMATAQVLPHEARAVRNLLRQRIEQRIPAAYLIGTARFAGLSLRTDARALVPRSPIAELIEAQFQPLLGDRPVHRVLDLCTGGGSIAVAMAVHRPDWQIDAADLSPQALALAADNVALHQVGARVRLRQSDGFNSLQGEVYDLIVSNPPYLTSAEFAALPAEYAHEPALALPSGADGLDLTVRILAQAAQHLAPHGLLIVEVGEAEAALRRLLPQIEFEWIHFSVGGMGVFAVEAGELRLHADTLRAVHAERSPQPLL